MQARDHVRPGDQEAADHLRRGARASSSTGSSTPASARSGASRRSRACRSRRSTRASAPRTSCRWGRTSSSTCSAWTPSTTSPSTCTSPTATASTCPRAWASSSQQGKLGAKTGGDGFYDSEGNAEPRGRRRPGHRRARRAADAQDVRRGLPGARGGRRDPPRHRLRDDGRRRPGPAPRAAAAVHEGRHRGPRHDPRAARERRRRSTASASRRRPILRRLVAQGRLGTKSGQGFYAYPQPDDEQPGERRQARDPRRRRDRLAGQRPDELDRARRSSSDLGKVWEKVKADRRPRARHRLVEPVRCSARAPTSRRSRRWTRPAARELLDERPRAAARARRPARRDDRRGQRPGVRRRLRAGDGLRRADRRAARRSSASPRSSSGSSRASAARSACRGWSARTRRSR